MKTILAALALTVALSATSQAQYYYPQPQPSAPNYAPPYYVPYGGGRGYTNSDGNWVPSPTYTPNGLPPLGSTARCADGTYSYSRHARGTCSHHGGVGF